MGACVLQHIWMCEDGLLEVVLSLHRLCSSDPAWSSGLEADAFACWADLPVPLCDIWRDMYNVHITLIMSTSTSCFNSWFCLLPFSSSPLNLTYLCAPQFCKWEKTCYLSDLFHWAWISAPSGYYLLFLLDGWIIIQCVYMPPSKNYLFVFHVFWCFACMYVYIPHMCLDTWKPEEGLRSRGIRVIHQWELFSGIMWELRIELVSSRKACSILKLWAIFLSPLLYG